MWYEPLMTNLNAYIDSVNQKVTGTVTVKLFKGRADVVAVETPNSIFDEKLATFMKSNAFNQNASAGFTEIYTMQMRLSQETERYALVSVGGDANKNKFLPNVAELKKLGYVLFATQGTHEFLEKNGVKSVLVHKASEESRKPNLVDLLKQNRFDLVINVPSPENNNSQERDGAQIRSWSVVNKVTLITDFDVFASTVERLSKSITQRGIANADRAPALL
jgi:argininosuccinate synthase